MRQTGWRLTQYENSSTWHAHPGQQESNLSTPLPLSVVIAVAGFPTRRHAQFDKTVRRCSLSLTRRCHASRPIRLSKLRQAGFPTRLASCSSSARRLQDRPAGLCTLGSRFASLAWSLHPALAPRRCRNWRWPVSTPAVPPSGLQGVLGSQQQPPLLYRHRDLATPHRLFGCQSRRAGFPSRRHALCAFLLCVGSQTKSGPSVSTRRCHASAAIRPRPSFRNRGARNRPVTVRLDGQFNWRWPGSHGLGLSQ